MQLFISGIRKDIYVKRKIQKRPGGGINGGRGENPILAIALRWIIVEIEIGDDDRLPARGGGARRPSGGR